LIAIYYNLHYDLEIVTMPTDKPGSSITGRTQSPLAFNEVTDARKVADEIKTGDVKEIGNQLAIEYGQMTNPSRSNLIKFINLVQADNAADLMDYPNLPALKIETGWSGDIKAYVTKPGWFGNMLRSKEEAFADLVSGNSFFNTIVEGGVTAVAEQGSHVAANDNATVVARSGSDVRAAGTSTVYAPSEATIYAVENSTVIAGAGTQVTAHGSSSVWARTGSHVDASWFSYVHAAPGAIVHRSGWAGIATWKP
jgi:hypothetical protein